MELAKLADGYSASDVKDICQSAQLMVVNDLFHSPHFGEEVLGEPKSQPRVLTTADFKEIISRRKPSVSMEMIRAYYKWTEQFKAL